jgi:hypothetical protein
VNAHSELDALLGKHASVALDHAGLHFDRAAHRVNHAAELDDRAVAGALDDAAMVHGDDWVDQVAPKGAEPCEDAIFVRASKPGVADDVGNQDRGEFPGLAHGAIAEAGKPPVASALAWCASMLR